MFIQASSRLGSADMLRLGFISLIGALVSGVQSFSVYGPSAWTWGKVFFFICLLLAVAFFIESERHRPSLSWALIDDFQSRRRRRQVTP